MYTYSYRYRHVSEWINVSISHHILLVARRDFYTASYNFSPVRHT